MNTDITITLSREELAALATHHIIGRLRALLPMTESTAINCMSELEENITPQISGAITVQMINGKVKTYYKDENETN